MVQKNSRESHSRAAMITPHTDLTGVSVCLVFLRFDSTTKPQTEAPFAINKAINLIQNRTITSTCQSCASFLQD